MRGGKGGNRGDNRRRLRRLVLQQGKGYGDVKARRAAEKAEARRAEKLALKNEHRERERGRP